jgi:hypothetical protein
MKLKKWSKNSAKIMNKFLLINLALRFGSTFFKGGCGNKIDIDLNTFYILYINQ